MITNYAPVHCLLRCKAVNSRCILWNRDTNGEKNIEELPLYLSISIPCVYDIIIYII
jgi:hypothetical protein